MWRAAPVANAARFPAPRSTTRRALHPLSMIGATNNSNNRPENSSLDRARASSPPAARSSAANSPGASPSNQGTTTTLTSAAGIADKRHRMDGTFATDDIRLLSPNVPSRGRATALQCVQVFLLDMRALSLRTFARGGLGLASSLALAALFVVSISAQKNDKNAKDKDPKSSTSERPKLSLTARPTVAIAPARVVLTAELDWRRQRLSGVLLPVDQVGMGRPQQLGNGPRLRSVPGRAKPRSSAGSRSSTPSTARAPTRCTSA